MPNWCMAHIDIGVICGELATQLDPQRGGMVCAAHAPGSSKALPPGIQQAEPASSNVPPMEGSRWEALRNWLTRNKIFFETIAATFLTGMAIIVSWQQTRLAKQQNQLIAQQTRLAEQQT